MLGQGGPTREEADLDVKEAVEAARESMTVRRVYSEPYERNGVTVIPAASVQGGAGGGSGEAHRWQDRGWWRLRPPRPARRAYVIRGDEVYWESALISTGLILGGQIVALLVLRSIRRARR